MRSVAAGPEPLPEGREDDGSGRAFVESPSTRVHLRNIARALLLRKYPILLQVRPVNQHAVHRRAPHVLLSLEFPLMQQSYD
eukprot:scaffold249788_cov30-Prasinocladus_malaysianus.AAC.1